MNGLLKELLWMPIAFALSVLIGAAIESFGLEKAVHAGLAFTLIIALRAFIGK